MTYEQEVQFRKEYSANVSKILSLIFLISIQKEIVIIKGVKYDTSVNEMN